jgi:hypothetical protein
MFSQDKYWKNVNGFTPDKDEFSVSTDFALIAMGRLSNLEERHTPPVVAVSECPR